MVLNFNYAYNPSCAYNSRWVCPLAPSPLLALATLYPTAAHKPSSAGGWRALAALALSFLSIGCPVCNKLIVLVFGLGGAMTVFNPLRPFLGLASLLLLAVTLFLRVCVLRYGCPVSFKRMAGWGT